MQGSFEAQPCADGHSGQCVQQMTPVKPIEWQDDSDAFSLIGDTSWSDYTVTSDVDLRQAGTVELLGRANKQNRPQSHQAAYELRISDTGSWSIARNSAAGTLTTLASGRHAALGTGSWHRIALGFSGDEITATVDGSALGTVHDSAYHTGQAGIGVAGYQTDQFDNLSVTPNAAGDIGGVLKGDASGLCADVPHASQANGVQVALWDCNGGANQQWTSTPSGQLTVYGGAKCLDVDKAGTADGTAVHIWDCNGGANQQWTVRDDGSVVSPASGKCLDATGNGTTAGTPLEIRGCDGTPVQQWRVRADGSVVNVASGTCLDAVGQSTANSTALDIWPCDDQSNQIWHRS